MPWSVATVMWVRVAFEGFPLPCFSANVAAAVAVAFVGARAADFALSGMLIGQRLMGGPPAPRL